MPNGIMLYGATDKRMEKQAHNIIQHMRSSGHKDWIFAIESSQRVHELEMEVAKLKRLVQEALEIIARLEKIPGS